MKRLSWREMLLVAVPLAIAGLAMWGTQLRERRWPTQPRIVECRVRPPTPLEISQGAQAAVTVRAFVPDSPLACPGLRFSFTSDRTRLPDFERKLRKASAWYDYRSNTSRNSLELQESRALNWTQLAPWQQPLETEVGLHSSCSGFSTLKKRFELTTKGLSLPNPNAAHQANFRHWACAC